MGGAVDGGDAVGDAVAFTSFGSSASITELKFQRCRSTGAELQALCADNGMVVYLMEDHELPSGRCSAISGSRLEPAETSGASWLSWDGDAARWHSAALG